MMIRYLVYLFLSFVFSTAASAQFSTPVVIGNTGAKFANNIITADVNNDGFKDVIASFYFNRIIWYQNVNGLTFGSEKIVDSLLDRPQFIDAKDIDGDDIPELLVSSDSADYAKVYYYSFDTLTQNWTRHLIDDSVDVVTVRSYWCDIDQDGDPDIISCHDLKVVTYLNNGGVFSAPLTLVGQSEFYNMVVRDFNHDNFPDFVVHSAGGVRLFVNNQNLTFSDSLIVNELHGLLETADIDQDSFDDIVFPNLQSLDCVTYRYAGNNHFVWQQMVMFGTSGQNPALKFNRMDADSFPDAVYSQNTGVGAIKKGILMRYNSGTGNFGAELLIDSVYNYVYVCTDDMDNDGDIDIVWSASDINGKFIGVTYNQQIQTSDIEVAAAPELVVYPNPSIGKFFIQSPPVDEWQVYSYTGEKLLSGISNEVDLSTYPAGLYLLKSHNRKIKRIVVAPTN